MASDNVINYPLMTRQREEEIQQGELARADDVNAELNSIVDVYNRLVGLLQGEWGGDTGRIYELVDEAVRVAKEALTKAEGAVLRTGDTMTGQLNQPEVPVSDYNLVNKKYVDTKIQDELASPINRISTLEDRLDNLKATQVKLENENFTGKNVNDGMNELFISVSNGKSIIATAVTDKGVPTSSDDSFKQIRDNIMSIVTFNEGTAGGTATPADVMKGKTFFARQSYFTGTYVPLDTSDATATENDIILGKTAYANGNKIMGINTGMYVPSGPITGTDTSDATAGPMDIVAGKTAYAGGVKIRGILQNAAVEEVYALENDSTLYEQNVISGYFDHSINPALPEGSKITLSGIFAITDGDIYDLSPDQDRLIDFIKVEIEGKIKRYIRARLINKTAIVQKVDGTTQEPSEKTLYSFEELGLDPSTDIQYISVGINGFQGRVSHFGLSIVQSDKLHIYDYNASTNWIGKDPRDNDKYVGHWVADFPYTETGNDGLIAKPPKNTLGVITANPAFANQNPNVLGIQIEFDAAFRTYYFLVLVEANTYTEAGEIKGRVYTSYSSKGVSVKVLRFSPNDNYLIGMQEKTHYYNPYYCIVSVDKTTYTYKNSNVFWQENTPIAIFDNDTKCMMGGKLYSLTLVNNYPTLTLLSAVQLAKNSDIRNAFVSIDGQYYIEEQIQQTGADSVYKRYITVYKLDQASQTPWILLQSFDVGKSIGSDNLYKDTTQFNISGTKGLSGDNTILYRYFKNFDTTNIAAIKYKNAYWYPTLQNLSATPADVTAGKTFIGASGIPEVGSKGGGEG